ncbi:hypothetical protein NECAME_14963 [Necator americanus]|uniref:Uncharacterized protein n=1 Tax=Necator americanus TaxID=51031 RepID=W2SKI4_NECAM|nr:hypothetical protein NECAME_14963 [Necator americanus]ETN70125.1 hypothetical protein NECAME_14963 [Necator americanus]
MYFDNFSNFHMRQVWLLLVALVATISAAPTPQMCAKFAKFVEQWNPLPETLLTWSKNNCDKIQPRPRGMTCEDVQRFIADCNYGGGGPAGGPVLATTNHDLVQNYYQKNFYFRTIAAFVSAFQTFIFFRKIFPLYLFMRDLNNCKQPAYSRADNIINIGLQQTYLPTCLHDLFYCIRASQPSPYQRYYAQREAFHREQTRQHRTREEDSDSD